MKTGADVLVEKLLEKEVEVVFAITGAGNLKLLDAISKTKKIKIIFNHHEQAVVMAAQGYSRISGKPGVAIVTTGGGTSNAVTGILSAWMDSDQVILISGNETIKNINLMIEMRAVGVQGFNSVAVYESITKFSQRIEKIQDIESIFHQAWSNMTTARFGPVHLDFPMDIQNSYLTTTIIPISPKQDDKVLENPNVDNFIKLLCDSLSQSLKPTFYFGNGLRNSPHLKALMEQINKFRIPYFVSWSAIDMFDSNDSLNLGRVGIYGDRASNILVQKSDFLLCLGTRLSIPQTGYDRSDFARKANKWIVEVDPTEMSKFDSEKWSSLICDVNIFLPTFIEILSNMDPEKFGNLQLWNKEIRTIKETFPQESQYEKVSSSNNKYLHSIEFVKELNTLLPGNSTVVTDVGAALLSTHFIFSNFDKFRLLTSQGLGEMGFGLPAAIGSFIADNKRTLVCINNDGSMMMNLQELQTMKFLEIPIKLFILNNYGYSSIRISQSNLYDSNYVGIDSSSGLSFPDFSDIAQTFGFKYVLIDGETTERQNKIKTILADSQPYLVEVSISPNQKFLPRLSTMRDKDGAFISPPLEDLEPLIEYRDLKNGLGYEPHINSKMIRNLTTEEETL